ncbi:MAG TPA: T9SS type A sorting domain-containing protein [bacterium]|jgi:hypothetical protein
MKYLLFAFTLLLFGLTTGFAQWTIPDTTRCPQPGTGAESPWISNDNLHLYMSSMACLGVFSRPSVDSAWGPRTDMPDRICLTPTQRCPAVSPNNDTLYFIGDARTDCENFGLWDVYYTIRTGPCDTCWGPVHNAGPNVSSSDREFSVGISRDGGTLLVSSSRGGYGVFPVIYWHERQADGTWGPANLYPPEINDLGHLSGHEHPCLSPDNNRIFFWHTGQMMGDIYVSEKVNGVWQQAVPLPSPPNNYPQVSCDADPCMAVDGRTLWIRESPYPCEAYRIAVTIDTSNVAATPRQHQESKPKPTLSAIGEGSGSLRLALSGVALHGEQVVKIHDILGRLVGQYPVTFTSDGQHSSSVLPKLSLSAGTYLISIQLYHGTVSTKYNTIE